MRGMGRIDGARIVVVHYGEHTPMDDGYRPARVGRLAALLQRHGAEVTRYVPMHSRSSPTASARCRGRACFDEGGLRMIPTRSFSSTFGAARFGFFADFARGTAAAIEQDGPFDLAVIGYPPPGVATAIRRATGGSPPILADIQDLWPDARRRRACRRRWQPFGVWGRWWRRSFATDERRRGHVTGDAGPSASPGATAGDHPGGDGDTH